MSSKQITCITFLYWMSVWLTDWLSDVCDSCSMSYIIIYSAWTEISIKTLFCFRFVGYRFVCIFIGHAYNFNANSWETFTGMSAVMMLMNQQKNFNSSWIQCCAQCSSFVSKSVLRNDAFQENCDHFQALIQCKQKRLHWNQAFRNGWKLFQHASQWSESI